jgi:hypothetical protein
MGSVTCSECGRVRWTPETSCPGCGARPQSVLPQPGLLRAPKPRRPGSRPWISASYRVVDEPSTAPKRSVLQRPAVQAAAVVAVIAVIVLARAVTADPSWFGLGAATPPAQILAPKGTQFGAGEGWEVNVTSSGTLEGTFSVVNGSAELCVTVGPSAGTPGQPPPTVLCPTNATYSSGFVQSAEVDTAVPQGWIWLWYVMPPGYNGDDPPLMVIWTSALVVHST